MVIPSATMATIEATGASEDRAWADVSELPTLLDRVDGLVAEGTIGQAEPNAADPVVRAKLAADIMASDIVILQMVDYNVPRWGYGLADDLLERWKNEVAPVKTR